MRNLLHFFLFASLAVSVSGTDVLAERASWYVATWGSNANSGSSSSPFLTIQHGINVAAAGDQVYVLAGTYTGAGNWDLDTDGKAITVLGVSGPAATVISGGGTHNGFDLAFSEEDSTTIIDGVTITNAVHGFHLLLAAPKIRNVHVENCSQTGIWFEYAEFKNRNGLPLVVDDCELTNNSAGLHSWAPSSSENAQIRSCTFTDNGTGASGLFQMWGCTISGGTTGVAGHEYLCHQEFYNCGAGKGSHILRCRELCEPWRE